MSRTAKTTTTLRVETTVPYSSIQDLGRPGHLSQGITAGGVTDRTAYDEGRALLDGTTTHTHACMEIYGMGGRYTVEGGPVRACLTGAAIPATRDGTPLPNRTTFTLRPGETLDLGVIRDGNIAYLSVGGGFDVPQVFSARATHLRAGIGGHHGRTLEAGDILPIGPDSGDTIGLTLPENPESSNRYDTPIRILPSTHTHLFSDETLARFLATPFAVTHEMDRMGARLAFEGDPLEVADKTPIISESIVLGDIQIIGTGQPTVLLADRQPTGGYPRIACIISADIDRFAQLPPGTELRFELVSHAESVAALAAQQAWIASLPARRTRQVRDITSLDNLLDTNLVSGAIASGDDLPWEVDT
ncbi:MAG: biotin-dependent carboxyltransferase family protein [Pseudomonadota bacterium]